MSAGVGRPVVRGVLFVRRTSCPSPLDAVFATASRLRFGGPAVDYGSAVNETIRSARGVAGGVLERLAGLRFPVVGDIACQTVDQRVDRFALLIATTFFG